MISRLTLQALHRQRRAVWFVAASFGLVEISLMNLSGIL